MAWLGIPVFRECHEPPGNESRLFLADMVVEMDVIAVEISPQV
jgi:hypothetical protein